MHPLKMRFSAIELRDLAKAWIVISLAFAVMSEGGFSISPGFFAAAAISMVTVGVGFLLHELMHKYFAQKYGCRAEFRAFDFMLLLAFVMSFFGFVFAAPGGVFIEGNVNRARSGRISAAGPLTNIVLAALFMAAGFFAFSPIVAQVARYGASINAWLAVFNMLPLMGLDGNKVLHWNVKAYAVLMAASVAMMVLTFSI